MAHPFTPGRERDLRSMLRRPICTFATTFVTFFACGDAVFAGTIGSPSSVNFQAGVLADVCNITTTFGSLAAQQDRTLITSDPTILSGLFNGSAVPSNVSVTSNMGSTAIIVADQPRLSGPSSASTSQVSLGGQAYATTSSLPTNANGSLSTTLNVRFASTRFSSGQYSGQAVVTCTDNGTP